MRTAVVITASDRVSEGVREDTSGQGIGARLEALGFEVQRAVLPDERGPLTEVLRASATTHDLIVTTGGTGLTPFADLSRGVVGVIGRALVINLPGSPTGALESLTAIEAVLDHALETLAGPYDHDAHERETGARTE